MEGTVGPNLEVELWHMKQLVLSSDTYKNARAIPVPDRMAFIHTGVLAVVRVHHDHEAHVAVEKILCLEVPLTLTVL